MTKSIALEVASRGITANCIAPGFIKTAMTSDILEKNEDKIINNIPIKRIGVPDDISSLTKFLASDKASYITGQTSHVNGGMLMQYKSIKYLQNLKINIVIYDMMGRLVRDLVSEYQSSGYRSIKWDATNNLGESVSAGMYFYMVDFGELKQVRKMLYIK